MSNALEEAELKKFQNILYMQSPYMHRQQLITVFPYSEIQAYCQSTLRVCLISSTWKYFQDHRLSCVAQCHHHFGGQICIHTLLPSSVLHFLGEGNQPRRADGSHDSLARDVLRFRLFGMVHLSNDSNICYVPTGI